MNIKELAEQAGLDWHRGWTLDYEGSNRFSVFAELIAAQEREECAKMVDHILKEGGGTYGDAIRARGKT